mmetsp:Transcript_37834/g.100572  ORF Transcript_37834/g.100572 Transcript_37834/m.100572 type:complete len:213 (-) Transcript_37834:1358-1996(-)
MDPAVRRSAGMWYLMKSSAKSWVRRISLLRLSGASRRRRSSCGLICTTSTANKVLASCIPRNARAKLCCSGDSDSIASRNSLGVGIVSTSSGIRKSSLSLTITPYLASNSVADLIVPTSMIKLLNCRACAPKNASAPLSPLKLCRSHACRYRSPPNVTLVAAFTSIRIGTAPAPGTAWLAMVTIGSLIDPSPTPSSIDMCPSGLCCAVRRTA